ncbi:MAG TPA: aspartate kinase [Anaerolineales bacterium]|nr:aspartate kinase [Anaerolineales bacterium]
MATLAVLNQLKEKYLLQKRAPTLVMKFGGTSVGTAQAMSQAAQIVAQARPQWPRLVVVVSALSGVTNLLLDSAQGAVRSQTQDCTGAEYHLRKAHYAIAEALLADTERRELVKSEVDRLVADFLNLCRAVGVLGEASPRALDALASLGERMSVRLMAAVLQEVGLAAQAVEASRLIVTDDHFQDAHPDFLATAQQSAEVLGPLFDQGVVPVVTGFLGATAGGVVTTLGRGGSDYTAGILGAVLQADDVWIWTDVDGVMTADPRAVPEARTIPELTYHEIAELAYYGAKVLHPKTIRPVIEMGAGLRICNTFNPSHPGTRLVEKRELSAGQVVRAVTAVRKQRLVTIEGRGMLGVPGVAARAFGAVASTGTSVPLITQASSEQSICFAVPDAASQGVVAALEKTFAVELEERDIDRIWTSGEVVILTVVGLGMIHTPGVAGKIFTLLGEKGVNVIAIAQGSSEVSISLVVLESDADRALQALHPLTLNGV